jgi:DNA-binding CsgD family transcriptional regulator
LVDRFESDGKRFVLAIRNPPQLTDPRALTERERQVAHLVAQGTSNKMIAYSLGISESTVATQLARALRKLGLRRREELALELSPMRVTDAAPGGADIAIGARPFPALLDGLSEAEQEVVNGVLRGLSDAAIAIARGTSPAPWRTSSGARSASSASRPAASSSTEPRSRVEDRAMEGPTSHHAAPSAVLFAAVAFGVPLE